MTYEANSRLHYKNIIPIIIATPQAQDGSSNPTLDIDEIVNKVLSSEKFESGIKNMIESHIIGKEILESTYRNPEAIDNPFDAIYLAKLEPDIIFDQDQLSIESFSEIEDLSDTIHFNDGWDD